MSNPSNIVSMQDPTIPFSQGIYEESSIQQAPLGTRLRVGDRTFYYSRISTSANVGAGYMVCASPMVDTYMNCTVAADTNALNKHTLTVTAGTNVAAGALVGGYLSLCSLGLSGGGLFFKIQGHSAFSSAATNCVITLFDDLPVATIAAGPANIIPSLYAAVQVGSAALDLPLGVVPVAITTGNYGWIQSWGPAGVFHEAATPAAAALALGTLGQVAVCAVTGSIAATGYAPVDYILPIGKNFNLAATASWANPVYLMITP